MRQQCVYLCVCFGSALKLNLKKEHMKFVPLVGADDYYTTIRRPHYTTLTLFF